VKEIIKELLIWWRFKKEISSFSELIEKYNSCKESRDKKKYSVCVLPAAGPGSLGDEAMLLGMKDAFDERGVDMYPIGFYEDHSWPFLNDKIGVLPQDFAGWRIFIPKLLPFNKLYINGADVIDGGYGIKTVESRLILAYIASKLGLEVIITGFSFSAKAPKVLSKLYSVLGKDVKFCVRDPFSATRFSKLTGKQAQLVADLAFMMPPKKGNYRNLHVFEWCKKNQQEGGEILGVNICAHTISEDRKSITPENIESFLLVYERALDRFLSDNENVSLVFIPHDLRGLFSDLNLALILKGKLISKFGINRLNVLEVESSADEIKKIVSEMDYVFSGRMHLAIASIGVSTPVACVTYQGKFEGLYDLVGLNKLLLIQAPDFNAESLYDVINDLKENKTIYKNILLGSQNKLKQYSNLNL